MDQPQVTKVVRHLVDEEGLARPVYPRVGEIALAERRELLSGHVVENARIARIARIRLAAAQVIRDLLDIRELLRSLDLRVRGKDLLDERRSRAGQADDENRIGARRSPSAPPREELGVAELDLPAGIALDELGAIMALGALLAIAALVIRERFGVLGAILERLAQSKAEMVSIDCAGGGRGQAARWRSSSSSVKR